VVEVVGADVPAGAAVVVVVEPRSVVVVVRTTLVVVDRGGRSRRVVDVEPRGIVVWVPSGRPGTTWPDQKLVSARAPAHDSDMCT
jgi:hypothetical protein